MLIHDMSGPDYAGAFRQAMAKNADAVISALDGKEQWLLNKIAKAARRYDIEEKDIKSALRECAVLRYYFAKNPARQLLHENVAAQFISNIPGIEDFTQVRSDLKHVTSGHQVRDEYLQEMHTKNRYQTHLKAIDFEWNFGGRKFYAYHKYTADTGGAQNSQFKDILTFLREATKNNRPLCTFVALCDGQFYLEKNSKTGETKFHDMKNIARDAPHGNVYVMTTADLPKFLENSQSRRPE